MLAHDVNSNGYEYQHYAYNQSDDVDQVLEEG